MKRLKKWFGKLDVVIIMIIFWVVLGAIIFNAKDETVKSLLTLILLPFWSLLLQDAMMKKQENNNFNIDLTLKDEIQNEIVWKLRSDNSQEDIVYLCVKNTGKIDIFSLYVKVEKNDGAVGWFEVPEMLNVENECIICVPYKKENIKEITLTCNIPTECRTKKYNGLQSGNQKFAIFSNVVYYENEKYAIYHEKGFNVFERMERFFI